jgi:hypothetical protein
VHMYSYHYYRVRYSFSIHSREVPLRGLLSGGRPGPLQVFWPKAIRQELAERALEDTGTGRSIVGGDKKNRHGEATELADKLAADAARRDRGGNIPVGSHMSISTRPLRDRGKERLARALTLSLRAL